MLDSALFSDALRFANLRVFNFLSFGPEETFLDLSQAMLTAVIGVNYDTGGDDSRNGTGKSALLIDAICYALFGKTLRGITSGNLVHKLARRGQPMTVILEYHRGPYHYQIERGENPSRLLWFRKPYDDPRDFRTREKDGKGKNVFVFDMTQRKGMTNENIIRSVGFDMTLFSYLVGITSENIPYIRLPEAQRRDVTESLFGFKRLSEIADGLKEDRDVVNKENIGLKSGMAATEAANKRIQTQIDGLIEKRTSYYADFERQLKTADIRYKSLAAGITQNHNQLSTNVYARSVFPEIDGSDATDAAQAILASRTKDNSVSELEQALDQARREYDGLVKSAKNEVTVAFTEKAAQFQLSPEDAQMLSSVPGSIRIEQNQIQSKTRDITTKTNRLIAINTAMGKLEDSNCPSCGQPLTPEHKATETAALESEAATLLEEVDALTQENLVLSSSLEANQAILARLTEEKNRKAFDLNALNTDMVLDRDRGVFERPEIVAKNAEVDSLEARLTEIRRTVHDQEQAFDLAQTILDLKTEHDLLLDKVGELSEMCNPEKNPDPYTEQIDALQKDALVNIDDIKTKIAANNVLIDHFQLLIDLATKKDSFIRKQLVQRWLPVLNGRISELLKVLELPHRVKFDAEMEMHISKFGQDYSNGNLSKGERTRLTVAVNFAFQELFETMNYKINLLIVDELIDSGICNRGAENTFIVLNKMVREQNKGIFLITHRSDITDQASSLLVVSKENDISTIKKDTRSQ